MNSILKSYTSANCIYSIQLQPIFMATTKSYRNILDDFSFIIYNNDEITAANLFTPQDNPQPSIPQVSQH